MKKWNLNWKAIPSLMGMFIIIGVIFGWSVFNAMAKESSEDSTEYYYKSVVIESGDCLWNIAEIYADSVGMTIPEYVQELKMMNRLKDDQIDAGQYLIVKYMSAKEK